MIVVRELSAENWAEWRDLRLAALREDPEAFSSKLADWQGENDAEPRWRARLRDVALNVLADLDGVPAGMVSAHLSERGDRAELLSMWVAPSARGRGVGDALVRAVVRWSEGRGAAELALRVAGGNEHALALYERHGFVARPAQEGPCEHEMVREAHRA
ncbi:GNAT family N-acetyltransferase [Amycolatopsis sp. VS8301801F10]|uniref:GNAT family N-acetyltransferase n=1 Tax=unclassified Amycolatopsis TaxID=2618356 RepID=UPI0038FC9C05